MTRKSRAHRPAERLHEELARIDEQLSALETDRRRAMESAEESNADDEHDPEGATLAFEREQLGALLDQTRRTRGEIEAALAAIDDGTYGTCTTCGGPIGAERLDARPYARTCITCAT